MSQRKFNPELPAELKDSCAPDRVPLLVHYIQLLLRENTEFNLTAIRDAQAAWDRHIVESLRAVPFMRHAKRVLDVGSGGGIPGLVFAIVLPETPVTLLEATGKKARFLESAAEALGLDNVRVVCERAETAAAFGASLRESFDCVTARAVAPMPVLLELTVPFLAIGGTLVAIKGERAADELEQATRALESLHVRVRHSERQPSATLVVLEKLAATPTRYPRRPGEPKRRPL